MADWGNVQLGMATGFQIGQKAGGKLSGLGVALKNVANQMVKKRETGEALGTLGQTERIKKQIGAEFAGPSKYGPEALEFERAKAGILDKPQTIIDPETFKPIGTRPKGSIFQPASTIDERKLTKDEREIIGAIRAGRDANVPLKEILDGIRHDGYDPDDPIFQKELEGYAVLPKPSIAGKLSGLIQKVSPF